MKKIVAFFTTSLLFISCHVLSMDNQDNSNSNENPIIYGCDTKITFFEDESYSSDDSVSLVNQYSEDSDGSDVPQYYYSDEDINTNKKKREKTKNENNNIVKQMWLEKQKRALSKTMVCYSLKMQEAKKHEK